MRFLLTSLVWAMLGILIASAQPPQTPAGAALSTIFSPTKAPQRKTMGLLQRSFLDLAGQGESPLEVAIVVDGTDSMATEIAGVRSSILQMIGDLRRYRQNDVRVALVVYRDSGSPSGEFTIPLARFTADDDELKRAVDTLVPESGAPFFHELPDVGIHTALVDLPWTADPNIQRWVLLFGDAPPYAEGFKDANHPQAIRRYATELLVAMAARKNVRINCVLCTSSENVVAPYDQAIDETRSFMSALATGTDGLMLDLSYPEIRTALIEANKRPEVGLTKIEPITSIDIVAAQKLAPNDTTVPETVTLAILPHSEELSSITFDPRSDAVQVSTALRHRFAQLPGVRVASPVDVERQLRRLRADGIAGDQALRGLAARLGVDYVVWGSVLPNVATVQTAAYRRSDGERVVQVSFDGDRGKLASELLLAASSSTNQDGDAFSNLAKRIQANKSDSAISQPMASDMATSREILAALEALEQTLAMESVDPASVKLLEQAEVSCRAALVAEPRNALTHWLLANIAYNQAMRWFKAGESEKAEKQMLEMKSSLARALSQRRDVESPSLVAEIEADHALLVQRDVAKAIAAYMQLTSDTSPLSSQLRAHWMLAGIYAGDWSVPANVVDPVRARDHVIQILANWPDSPEAALLKQWLRFDELMKKTDFNYLPQMNVGLTKATEA